MSEALLDPLEYEEREKEEIIEGLKEIIQADALEQWLDQPNFSDYLYGRRPREFLETPEGRKYLRDMIWRLRSGMFS